MLAPKISLLTPTKVILCIDIALKGKTNQLKLLFSLLKFLSSALLHSKDFKHSISFIILFKFQLFCEIIYDSHCHCP